jgi:hypothetical protein
MCSANTDARFGPKADIGFLRTPAGASLDDLLSKGDSKMDKRHLVGRTNHEWSLLKNQFDALVRTFRRPLIMAALHHSLFS